MPERKVYKFRIDPTAEQEVALARYAGARRFIFNWALQHRKVTYEQTGKAISWSNLSAELTELKNKPGFEWLKKIDSQLLQQALADCKRAFDNFFQKRAGFPKFKKKHSAHRETFRQIEYKARWRNRNFALVDRWFPSSQLCSRCGNRNQELSLSDRFWDCANCGARHDRDHNAAKNLRDEGIGILLAVGHTERLNACGASARPATAGCSR